MSPLQGVQESLPGFPPVNKQSAHQLGLLTTGEERATEPSLSRRFSKNSLSSSVHARRTESMTNRHHLGVSQVFARESVPTYHARELEGTGPAGKLPGDGLDRIARALLRFAEGKKEP